MSLLQNSIVGPDLLWNARGVYVCLGAQTWQLYLVLHVEQTLLRHQRAH